MRSDNLQGLTGGRRPAAGRRPRRARRGRPAHGRGGRARRAGAAGGRRARGHPPPVALSREGPAHRRDHLPRRGREPLATQYYLKYLADRPDSVVGALDDVASGPGPVLVHCAAGKDRTGVVVAMALAAVGVERSAVVEDYVLTGERIAAIMARLRASSTYAADLEGVSDDPASRAPSSWSASSRCSTSATAGPRAGCAATGSTRAAARPPGGVAPRPAGPSAARSSSRCRWLPARLRSVRSSASSSAVSRQATGSYSPARR